MPKNPENVIPYVPDKTDSINNESRNLKKSDSKSNPDLIIKAYIISEYLESYLFND